MTAVMPGSVAGGDGFCDGTGGAAAGDVGVEVAPSFVTVAVQGRRYNEYEYTK